MERLTSNKPTSDMNMIELAYNSCYADEKCKARYRNYELDIDSRELVKNLAKDMCDEDLSDMSDEEFDEYMAEMLLVEVDSQIGLLALFYRNLWAMANLRETLKKYEDLEEQGRLLKPLCKVGDVIWDNDFGSPCAYTITAFSFGECEEYICEPVTTKEVVFYYTNSSGSITGSFAESEIGKSVFLNKSEAEAKLKELRGREDESSNS
jgi:hypothetical protein